MKKRIIHHFIALTIGVIFTNHCSANFWENLWHRPDERAMKLLQDGKAKLAAQEFSDPEWQAIANYRAGNYKQASSALKNFNSARADYNLGNSLAHLGQYEEAIASYEHSLKINPNDSDATFNRDLLKKLLTQQNQQQQQQQNKQDNQLSENKKQDQKQNKTPDNNDQQKKSANANKPAEQPKQSNDQPKPDKQKNDLQQNQQVKENEKGNEKDQATNQWLSRIPEDPGGLLREKFMRDYQRRHDGE